MKNMFIFISWNLPIPSMKRALRLKRAYLEGRLKPWVIERDDVKTQGLSWKSENVSTKYSITDKLFGVAALIVKALHKGISLPGTLSISMRFEHWKKVKTSFHSYIHFHYFTNQAQSFPFHTNQYWFNELSKIIFPLDIPHPSKL